MKTLQSRQVIIVLIMSCVIIVTTRVYAQAPRIASTTFRPKKSTSMCVLTATDALQKFGFTIALKVKDWWATGRTQSHTATILVYSEKDLSYRIVITIVAGPGNPFEKADELRTYMKNRLMTCTISGRATGWEGIAIFTPSSSELLYEIPLRNGRYSFTLPVGKYKIQPTTSQKIDAIIPEETITCEEDKSYTINF